MPGADEVAQSVDAGLYSDDLPGLSSFSSAWRALSDFTGDYATNKTRAIQNYGDIAANVNVINY